MDACSLALSLLISFASPDEAVVNLDFGDGTLACWQGHGFAIVEQPGQNARNRYAVSSADRDRPGRTALLERTLTVPADAMVLRCRARAELDGATPDGKLDVRLLAGNRLIPKQVQSAGGWRTTAVLVPGAEAHEYSWSVAAHAGKPLRLVLTDDDARPGCHLHCWGFRFLTRGDLEALEFSQHMVRLRKQHNLNPMSRYDSANFTALSNADEEFSRARLRNCEILYRQFFDHFRAKGFALDKPSTKLMVAIFDTEAGFKAYVGPNELRGAQGFYHTETNRLVIYDYRQNSQFQASRQKAEEQSKRLSLQVNREQYLETIDRRAREFAADQNIALIVHEVAHQLAFNSGMFNRRGDPPFWVVEGHACYCESTENGRWLGMGKPNPERLGTLAQAKGRLAPLRQLVTGDGWKAGSQRETLLYYAQSWALFQMLMEEQPQALRNYLKLIYPRQTPDHRLTDFQQAFGADLGALEKRLTEYVRRLTEKHSPPR